ncbi:hypothetical protein GALL_364250 [mine drainage metagenome]|uniref:Uncharacterized protein n=1 Tax=mine drainage metagenome TaxID=410659 RepID=A0A1J5QF21_9ZZZZ
MQPVEQVFAKPPELDLLFEVAVGGRDDARRGLDRLRAPDPFETPLLQDTQDLDLQGGTHLGDLVEKQRAPSRQFEAALARALRARERAAFVAEQFAFHQLARNRAAVDGDERAKSPGRPGVQQPRHQFLARSGFALNQHRAVGGGDAPDECAQRHHDLAVA